MKQQLEWWLGTWRDFRGFEVENSLSWWAVDDGEWVAVIRVVKDPSCPSSLSRASWTQLDSGSHWDHRTTAREMKNRFPGRTGRIGSTRGIVTTSTGLMTSLIAATEDKTNGNQRLWHCFHVWNKNRGRQCSVRWMRKGCKAQWNPWRIQAELAQEWQPLWYFIALTLDPNPQCSISISGCLYRLPQLQHIVPSGASKGPQSPQLTVCHWVHACVCVCTVSVCLLSCSCMPLCVCQVLHIECCCFSVFNMSDCALQYAHNC